MDTTNASNKEDALRVADAWADSLIEAGKRLDPPDEVKLLTEAIAILTERRDQTSAFLDQDDKVITKQ